MNAHLISAAGHFVGSAPVAALPFQPRLLERNGKLYTIQDPGFPGWGGRHEPLYPAPDRSYMDYIEAMPVATSFRPNP